MDDELLIHALIISDSNGRFLVDVIRNDKLETAHLSGFIGALKMFGEETLGKIRDISINGLDIDMLIVSKYKLIMIAIMDAELPEIGFRAGCERALDLFDTLHGEDLKSWDGSLKTFRDFRSLLNQQIERYFKELEDFRFAKRAHKLTFEELKDEMVKYNQKFFKDEDLEEKIEEKPKQTEKVIEEKKPKKEEKKQIVVESVTEEEPKVKEKPKEKPKVEPLDKDQEEAKEESKEEPIEEPKKELKEDIEMLDKELVEKFEKETGK